MTSDTDIIARRLACESENSCDTATVLQDGQTADRLLDQAAVLEAQSTRRAAPGATRRADTAPPVAIEVRKPSVLDPGGGGGTVLTPVQQAAREAFKAGLNVFPPREDGSKAPLDRWKPFQRKRTSGEQCQAWWGARTGLGVICGTVSGNLELFEFDDRPTYEAFMSLAHEAELSGVVKRIEAGYCEDTPSGGVHWLYRCAAIEGSKKLATRPKLPEERAGHDKTKTLIETKGEGGYVILAPSHGKVHETGRPYCLRSGGFSSIVQLTPEERAELYRLARVFHQGDEKPQAEAVGLRSQGAVGLRPGDDYSARTTWRQVLEAHGWTAVGRQAEKSLWRRPGKRHGVSATTNHAGSDLLWVFSTSTPFEPSRSYDRFGAYAVLEHGGDQRAAARDLAAKGYGTPSAKRPQNRLCSPAVAFPPSGGPYSYLTSDGAPVAPSHPLSTLFRTARQLAAVTPATVDWIWPPYVAKSAITEMDAKAKAGKTTLIAAAVEAILSRLPFLDNVTTFTRVVWLTEERAATFRETLRRANLLDRDDLWVLSFADVTDLEWPDVVDLADRECERHEADLLVVDTLSQFARLDGDRENNAGDALQALAPLQRVAAKGRAVWLTRHERKGGGEVGESGRGSSAFAGGVDVVMALRRPNGRVRESVRVLHALSRFDETPPEVAIEWLSRSAHPSTGVRAERYRVLGTGAAVAAHEARAALLVDLPETETDAVNLDEFIQSHKDLTRSSCQRAIDALLEAPGSSVHRIGKGRRGDPHRYFRTVSHSAQTSHVLGRGELGAGDDGRG
jgi:hypothetical protein